MAREERSPRAWTRLDLLLVARGLAESRERAQAAVLAGEVLVEGRPAAKPGMRVAPDAAVALVPRRPRYVSRGGDKLAHALRAFALPVTGTVALDVGASTGGFTDCLLQHGAVRVYAVDVGRGQLDWRLRRDPRVVVLERTHAAHLDAQVVPEAVDLATVDVSFISLTRVLPAVARRVRPGGSIIALVKPQFEAGRGQVRKGVVRDPRIHLEVLRRLVRWIREQGWWVAGVTPSPLAGPKGNLEFFLWVVKDGGRPAEEVDAGIEEAVQAAHAQPRKAGRS
ncbi:MAG: TlyA family RNA methyltransferase [Armatimonadota bacterium]|nr:TlyA family RNA methyltransferase [Armatimonadota bacterium]